MIDATVRYVNDMGNRKLIVEVPLPQDGIPELEAIQLTDLLREYIAHVDLFIRAWHEGLYPTPREVPWEVLFPQPEAGMLNEAVDLEPAEWPKHTQENVSL